MKTKKEIRKLQKNLPRKNNYVVLDTSIANSTNYENKIKVGEMVHFVRNANVNDDFVSPLIESSPANTMKGFVDSISKQPEVYRIFANTSGIEDVFTPADLYRIPTVEELKKQNARNNEIIKFQNPYLAKSSFLKMIKSNVDDYFQIKQGRVVVGDGFKNNRNLFHFTNAQHAIISSGEMRMSHYQYEDDKYEVIYTINLISEICETLGESQSKIAELIEGIKNKVSQTYLLSLTSELTKDMWNEYGSNDGACIQFDSIGLNSIMVNELQFEYKGESIYDPIKKDKFRVMMMNNIIYDQKKQKLLLKELVQDFLNEKKLYNNKNTMILIGALYALFFKDPRWAWQKETRFVAVQNSEFLKPSGFQETKNYKQVPYISFKLFNFQNGPTPIKKVFILKEKQKKIVQYDLNKYEMPTVKVKNYKV